MTDVEARERVIAAALRVAAAERGGLDHANAASELELADDILSDAVKKYAATFEEHWHQ